MPAITNIFEQLRRDEELKLKAYRDSVGKLSIGYGRNLDDVGISKDESEYLLENDVSAAERALHHALDWADDLDDARYGVLVNMTFNMGIYGLLSFKHTLAKVQAGDYSGAAAGMLASKWAEQVGGRAIRLSVQMETGIWT